MVKKDEPKSGQITIRISPIARARLEFIAKQEYRSLNLQVEKFLVQAIQEWSASHLEYGNWPPELVDDFQDV
jgi:hypothetical protein